jgi:hypothetical protein
MMRASRCLPAGLATLAIGFGCTSAARLPTGTWSLSGPGVTGQLEAEGDRLSLDLWGDGWCTPVGARAQLESPGGPTEDADGPADITWLYVPVETGAGNGELALGMNLREASALLPLGGREGEIVSKVAVTRGRLEAQVRAEASNACRASLEKARKSWSDGHFRLEDEQGGLLGSVDLTPQGAVWVEVYHATMATDGRVEASHVFEGSDLVLTFPVEPSLHGELGALRLNVPTGVVVLPAGRDPTPMDRWWKLVPGTVDDKEARKRRNQATDLAVSEELEVLDRLGRALSTRATELRRENPLGLCPSLESIGSDWDVILADYEVRLRVSDPKVGPAGCVADFAPKTVQHTRRIAATVGSTGVVDWQALGLAPSDAKSDVPQSPTSEGL